MQPLLKCLGEWPAFLPSDETALLGAATADVFLNGVELGDALERLTGDRRRASRCQVIEVARVCAQHSKLDVTSLGELRVTGIADDLQNPLEPREMGDRPLGLGSVAYPELEEQAFVQRPQMPPA